MAPLLISNAHLITMDPGQPYGSGLVIEEGVITRVLTENDPAPTLSSGQMIDLEGRTILPGLIDSHLHLRKYAETLQKVDCETSTLAECLDRVKKRAQSTPPGKWILGHGWNHNHWAEGYGSRQDLDQISTEHPIYLTGKSLHVSWANSAALQSAGITRNTPDPTGGVLQRDQDNNLTGILLEDAVKLVENHLPHPSREEIAAGISLAQESLWSMGITGVHDFDRIPCLEALRLLETEGRLKIRVQKSIPAAYLSRAIEQGIQTGSGSDWLWYGGVKEFMDGALGPQTAAMLEPYENSEGVGMLLKSEDEIFELGRQAAAAGLALAVHAIGDRANRTLLNALGRIREFEDQQGIKPLPHRIEHLQLIHPADIPRLAELNIIASMQPIHGPSDRLMADAYWGERTQFAYAPKFQVDQGAQLIFGSDSPVESPNPWLGIHAAVTRKAQDGSPGPDGWHPAGRLSLQRTLACFTSAPAEAAGKGGLQGRLAPGAWADCVVLAEDPFQVEPDELWKIQPQATMVNGEWVWRDF